MCIIALFKCSQSCDCELLLECCSLVIYVEYEMRLIVHHS